MKISVIVPIYNMENFIARTISCLQEQEEPNLEFLLVNDGSTDSTLSLMQKMCEGDARFQIFTMKKQRIRLCLQFRDQTSLWRLFCHF